MALRKLQNYTVFNRSKCSAKNIREIYNFADSIRVGSLRSIIELTETMPESPIPLWAKNKEPGMGWQRSWTNNFFNKVVIGLPPSLFPRRLKWTQVRPNFSPQKRKPKSMTRTKGHYNGPSSHSQPICIYDNAHSRISSASVEFGNVCTARAFFS